jgi:hypothetical protein
MCDLKHQSPQADVNSEAATSSSADKIYIGKGRYIEDDGSLQAKVSKNSARDNSLTGGFAGGELFLKETFLKELEASKPAKDAKPAAPKAGLKKGLYIGKGRYLPDDGSNAALAIKRSARDNSLTGGFVGGEVGLKGFVATGTVPFGAGRQPQSPLIAAVVLGAAAAGGGLLLTNVSELGEMAVSGTGAASPAALAPLDENTKLLLQVAVLLVGVAGTVAGGRALASSLTSSIQEGATRLGTLAVFWLVVFVAARFIIDAP